MWFPKLLIYEFANLLISSAIPAHSTLLYPKFLFSCEAFHAALTPFQSSFGDRKSLKELKQCQIRYTPTYFCYLCVLCVLCGKKFLVVARHAVVKILVLFRRPRNRRCWRIPAKEFAAGPGGWRAEHRLPPSP